ncbi:malonyl-CoA synthase [Acuticoccus sp. M5D2P5]|uniref:malonate--CoA ligase n=1 Tax=Acuticoccus kalidii TaxID=2910977 RepID=UPI001F418019|nr:malonyl-CoA synthase [Acuticoccus kalidii]MCF3932086.1 malonyl-CoA synthase [Acuticoccus kalidii]
MTLSNNLIRRLSVGSDGRHDAPFAYMPDGSTVTYGQLWADVNRTAAALLAAGVTPGDRVAVQAQKSLQMLHLVLGAQLAGGVILPLNTAYTANEIAYFLGDAEPAVFICDPAAEAALAPIAKSAGVKTLATLSADGTGSWADRVAAAPSDPVDVPRTAEDLGGILYTSGTTGRSKGAMLTHEALASNAEVLKDYWRFTKDDVLIHALPIFHTHGLFVATNTTLVAGGSIIFMPKFDPDAILAAMPRATAMMGVPTFYTRLLDHPGLTREAVANMRLFVSGSAPLLAETHDRWRETTGHAILERYGMTETNMNTSNPYDGDRRAGTVGFPLPGVEVIVTNPETGEAVPTGEIGAIEVRGPNVFAGYWRMPEKTKEEKRENGFFITGDLGVYDERGYLTLVGRSKDLIITGGFNVYPKEIEGLIDDMDGVKESAVIGLPHPDFGEGVAAVVVKDGEADVSEASILDALKDELARFKQPKRVFFVDELPRNTMGKVQKAALRETYADTFAKTTA